MDIVESLGSSFSYRDSERKKIKKRNSGTVRSFASLLGESSENQGSTEIAPASKIKGRESLEEMLDQVYGTGDRLKESPTLDAIRAYRDAVRAFLKFVTARMLKIEKKKSGLKIDKRKVYYLISTIDEKLENLVLAVLRGQASHLTMLERVDQINGLIVDIIS
jgi:uncharacterized protein YaaR (DUF327 family)